MAKIPFSKLQASVNTAVKQASYCNKSGEAIVYEVKEYLSFEEKVDLVERIINLSVDDNGFYNPMKVKLFMTLETVFAYTNLSFTDKMKEDPFKLYDILVSTNIFNDIIDCIDENEWLEVQENVWDTIENIYNFRNSAMGLLSYISSDYSAVEMDASKIQSMINNPEALNLLKDVVSKLG
jgi:hypothetical protein